MVRKYQQYDPRLIRKLRIVLTVLTWTVWMMILFLQHDRILSIIRQIF